MFKRPPMVVNVHQPSRTEYVTREVREHRAPTDQSVALLKEMEKAAADKVIEAVHVGDTTFECVVHKMHDLASDRMIMRAVFSLNGKQAMAEWSFRPREPGDDKRAVLALRDEVAKVIAGEILADCFSKMPHR